MKDPHDTETREIDWDELTQEEQLIFVGKGYLPPKDTILKGNTDLLLRAYTDGLMSSHETLKKIFEKHGLTVVEDPTQDK